jgi:sulfate transport system ATP-binding protein
MELRVADIAKQFGDAAALRDVSLQVRAGELMALLGPSGSGKTTLLRIIAGLEPPDQGQVFYGGEDATALPVQRRQVGFVFQHYALFKHLTVFDNIAYGLRARERAKRPSASAIKERIGALLDLVQLGGLEHRFPAQLSGGQRQRVALARALAIEPRVLLLDEPFGALDAKVRKDLRRWLRDIHEETGQTTIFVTHDQDEAIELADRVAILNQGRLEQVGSTDEIQDAPASAFVMTFIGEAIKLHGHAEGGLVSVGGYRVPVPDQGAPDGPTDVYCRPWDLRLTDAAQAPLRGIIRSVRKVGPVQRAEIQIDGNGKIDFEPPLDIALRQGDRIGLAIERAYIFADKG